MMHQRIRFSDESADLLARPAEQLAIGGVRCWIAGYELGDIQCWETAWSDYSSELGPRVARGVMTELQHFVRALRDGAVRQISCLPHCCRKLCRDECMALSLLSASQHSDERTARVAAHYLSGLGAGQALDSLCLAASGFAQALSGAGRVLIPVPPAVIDEIGSSESAFRVPGETRH